MPEIALERLNELRYIAYPFIEDSLLTPMQTDVLLDIHAVVYTLDVGHLYLSSLEVAADESTVTATFTYMPLSGSDIVITTTVPSSAGAWSALDYYRAEILAGDLSLYPVFGPGLVNLALGRGGQTILFTDLQFEPACLCVRNRHIVNTMNSSSLVSLTGDVKLMPGYNMTISVIPGANSIRLRGIVGSGEGIPCEEILETPRNCDELIYRVNGASPDWYGDLVVEGGPGIMVTADNANNKIIIKTPFRACSPGCRE